LAFDVTRTTLGVSFAFPIIQEASMLYPPRSDEGQGLVEYALILVLVVLVVLAILTVLGPQIGNTFSRITNALSGT
jgi:pilus assembly protein Flp/PilA